MTIFTIGHSTRPFADFLALLQTHGVLHVADIRTIPRSKRPQFDGETLRSTLLEHGIEYVHIKELGGLRRPRRDSVNVGWKNDSFRGYADHMLTPEFAGGLDRLLDVAAALATTVMCAEAAWFRCHRALLSDALVLRGHVVRHVLSRGPARPHQLCDFARTDGTRITYVEDASVLSGNRGNRTPPRMV